jgi:hypothetical protein
MSTQTQLPKRTLGTKETASDLSTQHGLDKLTICAMNLHLSEFVKRILNTI